MKSTKLFLLLAFPCLLVACSNPAAETAGTVFNSVYRGDRLNRVAFPMGGMGAGMICLEGTGAISHVSVRHKPDVFHEPFMFGAISVKGLKNGTKVLEGPVPERKFFGAPYTGNGSSTSSYGFPRFEEAEFLARFPFATVALKDDDIPLDVEIRGWSPFHPTQEDLSSLPLAALEYSFYNQTDSTLEIVFSYHAQNFMRIMNKNQWGSYYENQGHSIEKTKNGFILAQSCRPDKPHYKGDFSISTLEEASVDCRWFRGGWYDARTMLWKDIERAVPINDTASTGSENASLYVPFTLEAGESKTIHLLMSWYVPHSDQRFGGIPPVEGSPACNPATGCCSTDYTSQFYEPWYSRRFTGIDEVGRYWSSNYKDLIDKATLFSQTLFASNLPPEVLEAVSANLSILKSPTILRQKNGSIWAFEGCFDEGGGCCHGSCTHVWNYAQAIPHLFPRLERSLRETEFLQSQDENGHQNFRSALPIQYTDHGFHAAADGQLGGMMKVYRDWRISGDTDWLRRLWPQIKSSYEFCSNSWDPDRKGVLVEPHHNTYDIEFWGPDGMCSSIYLGATQAMMEMGKVLGEDVTSFREILNRGARYLEEDLYNGEYFIQHTTWKGLNTPSPDEHLEANWNINYSAEAFEILKKEGPKYQYGNGCLADGIIGAWFDAVCGLPEFLDREMVQSHLNSIYRYNFRTDLNDHVNPQRPGFGAGNDGGLLLCTWPGGDQPSLPFVYSNEVWTGIEYQVASHLMMHGEVEKGLEIVREVRKRYNGSFRNPFNEYECGHWYARAMSSYALLQGLTGLFYDAMDKTLYINSQLGDDFQCFISTETGYGLAGLKNGEPFLEAAFGAIEVGRFENRTGQ